MKKNGTFAPLVIVFFGFSIACSILYFKDVLASVTVTATVPGVCGNSITEPGEQCDGTDLGGSSCRSLGYDQGNLVCHTDCSAYIVSDCTGTAPSNSGGNNGGGGAGGGGGGSGGSANNSTNIVMSGKAYPGSKVTLLKDGAFAARVLAGPDANFEFSVSNLNAGSYVFNVFIEDVYGMKSMPYVFPASLSPGIAAKVTGIFLAPTLSADKVEVKRGDVIKILGQSAPSSTVSVTIHSEVAQNFKALSDINGIYLASIDTSTFEYGDHEAMARSNLANDISADSGTTSFKVGTKNVAAPLLSVSCPKATQGDLNCDNRINLVDYSIMAFWYLKPNVAPAADLNHDGKVNLVDFSIMAFNWTG